MRFRQKSGSGRIRQAIGGLFRHCAIIVALLYLAAPAQAQNPSAQRGLNFARTHCAQCHSLDKYSRSPLSIAPPFRTLHEKYPVETLEEALGEGITTGHPTMPQFRLEPDQVGDFIAFLRTLQ